jgi:hypothetical protein
MIDVSMNRGKMGARTQETVYSDGARDDERRHGVEISHAHGMMIGLRRLVWLLAAMLILTASGFGESAVLARGVAATHPSVGKEQLVTLIAKPARTVRVGTKVTLTARITQPSKVKGDFMYIGDLSNGSTIAFCKPPTCTGVVRYAKPARHVYAALVTRLQKGLLGHSSPVTITWKKK